MHIELAKGGCLFTSMPLFVGEAARLQMSSGHRMQVSLPGTKPHISLRTASDCTSVTEPGSLCAGGLAEEMYSHTSLKGMSKRHDHTSPACP